MNSQVRALFVVGCALLAWSLGGKLRGDVCNNTCDETRCYKGFDGNYWQIAPVTASQVPYKTMRRNLVPDLICSANNIAVRIERMTGGDLVDPNCVSSQPDNQHAVATCAGSVVESNPGNACAGCQAEPGSP
jgi:hypothetical protein